MTTESATIEMIRQILSGALPIIPKIRIGEVTAVDDESEAGANIVKDGDTLVLNLIIPRGRPGEDGNPGPPGPPGSDATVPSATSTEAGKVKLGSDIVQTDHLSQPSAVAKQTYPVQVDEDGHLVVNVPHISVAGAASTNVTYITFTAKYPSTYGFGICIMQGTIGSANTEITLPITFYSSTSYYQVIAQNLNATSDGASYCAVPTKVSTSKIKFAKGTANMPYVLLAFGRTA